VDPEAAAPFSLNSSILARLYLRLLGEPQTDDGTLVTNSVSKIEAIAFLLELLLELEGSILRHGAEGAPPYKQNATGNDPKLGFSGFQKKAAEAAYFFT
jgi:hypothetical protein